MENAFLDAVKMTMTIMEDVLKVNVVVKKAIVVLLLVFVLLQKDVKQTMVNVLVVDVVLPGVLVHQANAVVKKAIVVLLQHSVILLQDVNQATVNVQPDVEKELDLVHQANVVVKRAIAVLPIVFAMFL